MANNNLYCNAFSTMTLVGVNVGKEPTWYDKEFCKFQVAQSFGPREGGFTLWHAVTANDFQFTQLRRLAQNLPSGELKGARLDVTLVNPIAQHYEKDGQQMTSVAWSLAGFQLHGNKPITGVGGSVTSTSGGNSGNRGAEVNGVIDPLYNLGNRKDDISDDDIPF